MAHVVENARVIYLRFRVNFPEPLTMRSFTSLQKVLVLYASIVVCSVSKVTVHTSGGPSDSNQNDRYASTEEEIALQGILNNIGSAGSKSSGALNGVVVAAPSDDPNYK